jgi:hypothetical protein
MNSILITVNIEIKPYLKKFLLKKSVNQETPVRFPNKHHYNLMLLNLVTNYNSLQAIPVEDRENVLEYFHGSRKPEGEISIILPFNERKDIRSYRYLSVKSKQIFRNEVRIDFNFEFTRFLVRNLKKGVQRLDICNEFKNLYEIGEDELKTESLYRYSTRLLEEF